MVTVLAPAYATRNDVGFAGDSGSYVIAARTFAREGKLLGPDGHGGVAPYSSWPPLYPWVLGFLSRFFGDVLPAARWLNIVLFPLNVLLLAAVARRFKISPGWTVFVCALFVFAPSILAAHVEAMSGSLFLTCWLLNWFLILRYGEHPSWGLIVAAGAAGALTLLNRYFGFATIAAFSVYLCLGSVGGWARKITAAAIYFVLGVAPVTCWLWFSRQSSTLVQLHQSNAGPPSFFQSWVAPELAAFARWVLPADGHNLFKAALAFLLVVGIAAWMVAVFRGREANWPGLTLKTAIVRPEISILLNLVACQMILVCAKMVRDHSMLFDERQEMPVFVCTLLIIGVLATACAPAWRAGATKFSRYLVMAVLTLFVAGYVITGAEWVRRADAEHLVWSSRPYRDSPARALVDRAPAGTPIYGNILNPLVYYTTRIDLYRMPDSSVEINGQRNPQYAQEVADMIADVVKRRGLIVVFNTSSSRFASSEELKKNPQLRAAIDTPEVAVFEPSGG